MPYFTKHSKPNILKNKWKKIIDFTKINRGGVDIDKILIYLNGEIKRQPTSVRLLRLRSQ